MSPRTAVIAPDLLSGVDFFQKLKTSGVQDVSQTDYSISPRVEGEQITSEILKVAEQLAQAVMDEIGRGVDIITIACNTLSLPVFTDLVLKIINDRIEGSEKGFQLILTIPQIKEYLEKNNNKKIIVLGTIPLSKILAETQGFPTPSNINGEKNLPLLRLVQEIIWRVKMMQGSDTTTAPIYEEPLDDLEALKKKLELLNSLLSDLGIEEVIMGCTELPHAFSMLKELSDKELKYTLIDPAHLVADKIKMSV
jgi:glutamate racemase